MDINYSEVVLCNCHLFGQAIPLSRTPAKAWEAIIQHYTDATSLVATNMRRHGHAKAAKRMCFSRFSERFQSAPVGGLCPGMY